VVHTGKPLATGDYNKTLAQPPSRPIVESLMGLTVNHQKSLYFIISCQKCNVILLRFSKIQILKFKSQVTFAFFTAVNHLSRPLRKQMFNLKGSKGHGL